MNPEMAIAVVRFRMPGFHHWPTATKHRAYLREMHRHLFHVEVKLQVKHDDREVEFHDLLEASQVQFEAILDSDRQDHSCEAMARHLLEWLRNTYPGRPARASVFEDGEVGAEIGDPM